MYVALTKAKMRHRRLCLLEVAVYRLPQREKSACVKLFQALQNTGDFDIEEECPLT